MQEDGDKIGKLFIHIGSPKTGSTSLQDFLYEHKEDIKNIGITMPEEKFVRGGGHTFFRQALTRKESSETLASREYHHSFFSQLLDNKAIGLISSEMLWGVAPRR